MNISLPNFTEYLYVNNFFITLNKKYLKNENINFSYMHGSFPYCYWNGYLNSNKGHLFIYKDFLDCIEQAECPLRFNFSNICLQEIDFYDCMSNIILNLSQTGSNIVEIADLKLLDYIQNNYKFYNDFVISSNYFLLERTEEDIKFINDNENIKLIQVPYYIDISKFKKSKIELEINPLCDINCENYINCIMVNNMSQYKYSSACSQSGCNKINHYLNNKQLLSLKDLENYTAKGIKNFYISENYFTDINEYFDFLILYFIKDEFKNEVVNLWKQK